MYESTNQLFFCFIDIYNGKKENLLFAAIWDKTATKDPPDTHYKETAAPEFIDSDDDDESATVKRKLNIARTPPENQWKRIPDDDPVLEERYNEVFRSLLQIGFDVNYQNADGQNLAHIASERDNIPIMLTLIELGVNVSHADGNCNRPMHLVNSVEMFRVLPAVDIGCVNKQMKTPMLMYLNREEHDEQLLRLFITAGSDIKQSNSDDGDQALHLVRHPEITKMLLDGGADVNARNHCGNTPALSVFERDHNMDVLQALFNHPDHDVFACNESGHSFVTYLVPISEEDFAVLRPAIGDEKLQQLYKMHCNCSTLYGYCLLSYNQQDDENLYSMQTLLDIPEFKIKPQTDWFPSCSDPGRWLVECGSHMSQRHDKNPLDWQQCPNPSDYLAQLNVFAAAGFNTELENRMNETALQCYSNQKEDHFRDDMRIVARLLMSGADYRRCSRIDGKPVLDDTVFSSLYEWDDEKGVGILHQVFHVRMFIDI